MIWRTFCRYTTVGQRNKHDVIKSLTPVQLEVLKDSVSEALPEESDVRAEMLQLIDEQLKSSMAHHG